MLASYGVIGRNRKTNVSMRIGRSALLFWAVAPMTVNGPEHYVYGHFKQAVFAAYEDSVPDVVARAPSPDAPMRGTTATEEVHCDVRGAVALLDGHEGGQPIERLMGHEGQEEGLTGAILYRTQGADDKVGDMVNATLNAMVHHDMPMLVVGDKPGTLARHLQLSGYQVHGVDVAGECHRRSDGYERASFHAILVPMFRRLERCARQQ